MVDLDKQTSELVLRYLGSGITLGEFRGTMMRNALRLSDPDVNHNNPVTGTVLVHLDEYSRGHRTETEIAELLGAIVGNIRVGYSIPAWRAGTSTPAPAQSARWLQLVGADR